MVQAEKEQETSRTNPLIWVSIVVVGLILFIFVISDRGSVGTESLSLQDQQEQAEAEAETAADNVEGQINRDLLVPPGLRAREFIDNIRQKGKPYPLEDLMAKASTYVNEGSLADAHLTFFFAAREGHVEAMMMMAEMSDPTLFQDRKSVV